MTVDALRRAAVYWRNFWFWVEHHEPATARKAREATEAYLNVAPLLLFGGVFLLLVNPRKWRVAGACIVLGAPGTIVLVLAATFAVLFLQVVAVEVVGGWVP